jgi:hypothetical protein
MSVKFNLEVTAPSEEHAVKLLKMCGFVQYLGSIGASRKFEVFCDGDGSARFTFSVNGKKLPSWSDQKDDSLEHHSFDLG